MPTGAWRVRNQNRWRFCRQNGWRVSGQNQRWNLSEYALGRDLRDEVGLKALRPNRIDHMLFTLSGNGPHASLKADLDAASTNRDHYVVNIHIEDHQDFIAAMYEEAENLGNL